MKDFLEVLREQMDPSTAVQLQLAYLSRLRGLARHRPCPRQLPKNSKGSILRSRLIQHFPDPLNFHDIDLGLVELKLDAVDPTWLRQVKQIQSKIAFLRWDAVNDEAQILESIAMGADAYSLDVGAHEAVSLQYLCEIGMDYEVPALLHCYDESQLARAMFIQSDTILHLAGELGKIELLELPIFQDRTILLRADQTVMQPDFFKTAPYFSRLILHLDAIDERSFEHD